MALPEMYLSMLLQCSHIYMYRSVPLIRPPILYTTSRLKWGGGLIFEDAISLDYKPPPPPKKDFTQVLCTQLGHFQLTMATTFRIESTVHRHHVYKAAWSPYIGEELPVQREVNNIHDDFAVAVLKNGNTQSCTTGNLQSLLVFLAQEWQRDDLHRQW